MVAKKLCLFIVMICLPTDDRGSCQNFLRRGTAATHSGYAAQADARVDMMSAVRASGYGCPSTARAGLQDVFADANYGVRSGGAHVTFLIILAARR